MNKDPNYLDSIHLLDEQYKNSNNLGDRAQLHNRFGSNPTSWFPWIYSFLNIKPGDQVLECGAGPGWLWQNNLDQLPDDCHVIISDLSKGMVNDAKEALKSSGYNFSFEVVDVQNLRFQDNHFDIVIANHMLYHVPRFEKAMQEIKRVLKPKSRFLASTVGYGHMREIRQLAIRVVPELEGIYQSYQPSFTLENGKEKLSPWFPKIERFVFENKLRINDSNSVISYILSTSIARDFFEPKKVDSLNQLVNEMIKEKGYFSVSTSSGLFKSEF